MKIVFFIFIFAFTFQYSSTFAQNTLTKEQVQFLQVLKSSLEQKEILKYLKKNDFFIDDKIYVTNDRSPMKGLNHTLKLKSGEYVKIQNKEELFFYAINKHLAVFEYEIKESNSRLIINNTGSLSITTTLEFSKGWNVTDHSISE